MIESNRIIVEASRMWSYLCVLLQMEEGRDEPPIDVVGDNDIKQEPDTPEVTFSLAEPVDSAIDRNDDI